MKPDSIFVIGPTASGKTRLAAHLAALYQTDVVSADSRQVYSHMNIGTGKDYEDYTVHGVKIKAHLLDIVQPGQAFHIHQYKLAAAKVIEHLQHLGKMPIVCGGSGLYLQALVNNLQYTAVPVNTILRAQLNQLSQMELQQYWQQLKPTAFNNVADTGTVKRLIRAIEINTYLQQFQLADDTPICKHPIIFGLELTVVKRRERIHQRLLQRLEQGLVQEVEQLLTNVSAEQLIFYGLEYKIVTQYLLNQYSYAQMVELLTTAIQQFAKRQMTFFRKMEKDGLVIHWLDADRPTEVIVNDAAKLIGEYL
ncbi:MAG: tRNA (adenosine(37)-N6)-dimethylallyltransferase MiaA [Bacteroidia bacterium]|nr:tRNA (adenosine(37)-N6)-dimethylallyltransferase MiaA [Bacteroidia bacterium]